MAERSKAAVLKTVARATGPGVRIPLPPPFDSPGVASARAARLAPFDVAQEAPSVAEGLMAGQSMENALSERPSMNSGRPEVPEGRSEPKGLFTLLSGLRRDGSERG